MKQFMVSPACGIKPSFKEFGFITARMIPMLVLCTFVALAQTPKGKIAGKVVDVKTKEALIGVNVLVEGTKLGAATDLDGTYYILNIEPGTYALTASAVGYRKVTVTNVDVFVDRTTTVNFSLEEAAIQQEPVIVVAERPAVVKDRTSTATFMDVRDIERAPIEGLRQAIELNAGIAQNPNGTYSVRGSGAYEVNFQINGVEQINSNTGVPGMGTALGDKANNSWKYDFNPLGVKQMEIISGGFSAEYGNAQAGVVKVVTKEGGPKFSGEFRVEYRPPGQYHWGRNFFGSDNVEWQKWGTLEGWRARLDSATIVSTYQVPPDSVDIWRQLMWQVWVKNHSPSDDNQLGVYDYTGLAYARYLLGVGGPLGNDPELLNFYFSGEYRRNPTRIPTIEKVQVYQNYTATLISHPIPNHKFKLMGMYQYYRGGVASGSEDIRWAGRDGAWKYNLVVDSPRDEITLTQSLSWTYTMSKSSFLEVVLSHQTEKYVLLVVPVVQRPGSWRDNVFKNSWYIIAGPWDEGYRTIYSFTSFNQQDLRTDLWNLAADFTSQVTPTNLLKTGIRAQYWSMLNSAVYSSFAANAFISRSGYADYYEAYPYYFAVYAQDKMEYQGMVANVGVRVDGYNFNTSMPANRFNPLYFAVSSETIGDPSTTMPQTHIVVSPRLGLSFPIGENTAFRVQYGHFSSMPIFKQAYGRSTELGWLSYSNPGLGPKKTINYEFGLQQSIGETHRLDIAAYYNDRVSQVGTLSIRTNYYDTSGVMRNGSGDTRKDYRYTTYDNNGYGATHGIEIAIEKVSPGSWSYRLSYSLARTTFGNYGPRTIWSDDPNDPRNFQERNFAGDFISYEDRTHTFRGLITYALGRDEGMEIFGKKPFENLSISLTYTAQSGVPFTYVTTYDEFKDIVNNRRYPLEQRFDLNITKRVSIAGLDVILGMRVMNLFDNKWLTPFDSNDDVRDWIETNITPDKLKPGEDPFNPRATYKFKGYTTYRNVPRQIFFSAGFAF